MSDVVTYGKTDARTRRHRIFVRLFALLIAFAILNFVIARRVVVINTSPSVKPGLYLRSSASPAVGELVDFSIPATARNYVRKRSGNGGESWYILKPIAAGPGDQVDTTSEWLVINGHKLAPMPPSTDSSGRPLPVWRQSRVLAADEFFVFSDRIPNSFDSRCYGPIERKEIASVRKPLLTW